MMIFCHNVLWFKITLTLGWTNFVWPKMSSSQILEHFIQKPDTVALVNCHSIWEKILQGVIPGISLHGVVVLSVDSLVMLTSHLLYWHSKYFKSSGNCIMFLNWTCFEFDIGSRPSLAEYNFQTEDQINQRKGDWQFCW